MVLPFKEWFVKAWVVECECGEKSTRLTQLKAQTWASGHRCVGVVDRDPHSSPRPVEVSLEAALERMQGYGK